MSSITRASTARPIDKRLRKPDRSESVTPRHLLTLILLGFSLLVASKPGVPAEVSGDGPMPTTKCPALLLDHECRAYKSNLESAATPQAREMIQARYDRLLKERERTCPCDASHDAWIRVSKSATRLTVPSGLIYSR
ncbi:MAG: hypothetical protein ACLPXB_18495 [Thiobacillaceae bacterium]